MKRDDSDSSSFATMVWLPATSPISLETQEKPQANRRHNVLTIKGTFNATERQALKAGERAPRPDLPFGNFLRQTAR